MPFFSKFFRKSAPATPEPTLHNGFVIFPEPIKEGAVYRIAARIEKEVGGEMRTHSLVRADTHGTLDSANDASIAKAKMAIDQLGDTIFR